MDITTLLPGARYRIAAQSIIAAAPPVVWKELVELPMSALPVGFLLTLVRHFPDVAAGNEKRVRGTSTFLDATPIPVVVEDEPFLIVSAGPSQAWKLLGGTTGPALTAAQFVGWEEPGWIKVAMQFELTDLGSDRGTLLSTETRIAATDAGTARLFAPYWWMIRASSALIRREVVAKVKKRAEAR